jgi:uncharacterized protein with NRDE domain
MCTLVLLRRPGHDWPLVLGANRDEMLDRPAKPPGRHWPDRPELVAGLDELAGGSWFGLNDHGVIAGILNREGSLGPSPGQRSRGELVLEALDHADALEAAMAVGDVDPRAYRSFNMIIADNRDAFWLRHADPIGSLPVEVRALSAGLGMIASGDLDDTQKPRLRRYRPRFAAALAPDPGSSDWAAWETLLADDTVEPQHGPRSAMRFSAEGGFATLSSTMVALPAVARPGIPPVFRFRLWQPSPTAWADVPR